MAGTVSHVTHPHCPYLVKGPYCVSGEVLTDQAGVWRGKGLVLQGGCWTQHPEASEGKQPENRCPSPVTPGHTLGKGVRDAGCFRHISSQSTTEAVPGWGEQGPLLLSTRAVSP